MSIATATAMGMAMAMAMATATTTATTTATAIAKALTTITITAMGLGPVCSSHTEPVLTSKLHPRPKDLKPLHQAIVLLICFESFARLHLSQYRSRLHVVTLTMCIQTLWKSKKAKKASG
jgi:hypothetical protein